MKFNHVLLDIHLRKKQFSEELFEIQMCKEIGISRTTLYRIGKGKEITINVFLKCLDWLEGNADNYIKKE